MASIVVGRRAIQCDVRVVIGAAEIRVLMVEASPLNGGARQTSITRIEADEISVQPIDFEIPFFLFRSVRRLKRMKENKISQTMSFRKVENIQELKLKVRICSRRMRARSAVV